MTKIIFFSVIICVLSIIIKRNCIELYLPFQLGAAVTVLIYILSSTTDEITTFFSFVESLGDGYGIIKALIKASLITVATKLGCDICKENGNILVGDVIELGGKMMILAISVPYLSSAIKISAEFLE
jgi:hypothetical protein